MAKKEKVSQPYQTETLLTKAKVDVPNSNILESTEKIFNLKTLVPERMVVKAIDAWGRKK